MSIFFIATFWSARAQEEFTPVGVPESAFATSRQRDAGPPPGYADSTPSPRLVIAEASADLAVAANSERSSEQGAQEAAWRKLEASLGPTHPDTLLAHSRFLKTFVRDFSNSLEVYRSVEARLGGIDPGAVAEQDQAVSALLSEYEILAAESDAGRSLDAGACAADPNHCPPADADGERILADIEHLAAVLNGSGESGSLAATAVLNRARALRIRAELALKVAQNSAMAIEVATWTPRDGKGRVRTVPELGVRSSATAPSTRTDAPYRW